MLTDTEHKILGHLAELLTAEEIAALMAIPVSQVRTHIRTILRKLASGPPHKGTPRAPDLRIVRE